MEGWLDGKKKRGNKGQNKIKGEIFYEISHTGFCLDQKFEVTSIL